MLELFYWEYGWIFQLAMVVHFFRTRPQWYWFMVILFFGPPGALIYFFMEVVPGIRWKLPAIERLERRKRRAWLEKLVSESPSQEALSELAWIEQKEANHAEAVDYFTLALQRDSDDLDCYYGRGLSQTQLENLLAAIADLKRVVAKDPTFNFHEAYLALAEAYEGSGDDESAARAYETILGRTTVSRAYYNYGKLLAKSGDSGRAKKMMEEIVSKQTGLPRYLKRQERPWVRKAKLFLKTA